MKQRRNIFGILGIVLLGGCQATITPGPGHLGGPASWTRSDAKQTPLIYASGSSFAVLIYNYRGQRVGELDGLEPKGLCSDSRGDVFVTSRRFVYEYQPGGSLPVNLLDDRPYAPVSCAVDPTTGDVAVANAGTGSNANVAIFPEGASSNPVVYAAPNISTYEFCAYDPSGNLYVDGTATKQNFELAALYAGSKSFVAVSITNLNQKKHFATGLTWDGQYVAVGDFAQRSIYRLTFAGSSGQITQTVPLKGWRRGGVEFAVVGNKLLLPQPDRLLFYAYPAGGKYKGGFLGNVGYYITVPNGT